jgi:hypothetical protein
MGSNNLEEAYQAVIEYIRAKHVKEIDTAYDYFWEEDDPTDILSGHAMELGFINFEDWLICDYLPEDGGKGFIDRFIEDEQPESGIKEILLKLQDSYLSLYEVKTSGTPAMLADIAVGGDEFKVNEEQVCSLEKGYSFAARFIELNSENVIGRSVYPFGIEMKSEILKLINAQFKRYKKNKNTDGNMKDFLRDESYAFNMTWVSCLQRPVS